MNFTEQVRSLENISETESEEQNKEHPKKRFYRFLSLLGEDLKPDAAPPPPVPVWLFIGFLVITLSLIVLSVTPYKPGQVLIPRYIYVAAGLGTSAYLFTNIASSKVQTFTPLQAITRFVAGPLVSSGGYLLSQILFEESLREGLPAAGIAFLAGFSMEIFVQAFNVFAHRLLRLPPPDPLSDDNSTTDTDQLEETDTATRDDH